MKNRVLATINLIIGTLQAVVQVLLLIVVYPKLPRMYNALNIELPLITKYLPVFSIVLISLITYSLYLSGESLKEKNPSDKLLKQNIVLLVFLLVSLFLLTGSCILALIQPMYVLTTSP